jgi:hypothetical protein
MMGQEIMTAPFNTRTDVSSLSVGTYLITVTDGTTVEKLKFIKK